MSISPIFRSEAKQTFFNDDITDQYEYFDIYKKNTIDSIEQLWLNVLEQGIYDFIEYWKKRENNLKEFNEIYQWFFKNKSEEIGSFNFICNSLNINKYKIYRALSKFVKENSN